MKRFSEPVERALRAAGWSPTRDVSDRVEAWRHELSVVGRFPWSAAAAQVLAEFGGLSIGEDGRGEERARTSIQLDPALAVGEERFFGDHAPGLSLFPLGEVGRGHALLGIDPRGGVYILFSGAERVGRSFDDALERLVRGLRPA